MAHFADLHIHSNASDGQYSPSALVGMAKDRGLQVIALTDHDSVAGIEEAVREGERLGVKVVPGIEMSAREYHTFHILGYCFDPIKLSSTRLFRNIGSGRAERSVRIMDYLRSKGVDFALEEVQELASTGVIGRPHFARIILKHGICQTWEEVFDTYLDTDEFHEVVEDKPTAQECISAIREAGGIASLAHPYQTGLEGEELENLVKCMINKYGLEGIECWHSGHTQERSSFYLHLAKKYNLIVTGGSDFHGEQIKADRLMAKLTLELDWLLDR